MSADNLYGPLPPHVNRTWLNQFGKEYDIPLAITQTWIDQSWTNDVCPSFIHPEMKHLKLWVEHPVSKQREHPASPRFALTIIDSDGATVEELGYANTLSQLTTMVDRVIRQNIEDMAPKPIPIAPVTTSLGDWQSNEEDRAARFNADIREYQILRTQQVDLDLVAKRAEKQLAQAHTALDEHNEKITQVWKRINDYHNYDLSTLLIEE